MKVWINGKVVDEKNAAVSVFDRGFLYGDGVFETMRSYSGAVFRLEEHLARLCRSSRIIRIRIPRTKKQLGAIIDRLLKINRVKDAYVRVSVSRGAGAPGIDVSDSGTPTVTVVARRFVPFPQWMYDKGVRAKVVGSRLNVSSGISGIKSLNYLVHILARLEAREDGFDEAILMNTKGDIAEAATSNVFLVREKKLVTPSLESGALPGITRSEVLELAARLGLKPVEKRVSYGEVVSADEVFLTNSLFEIVPMVKVDTHVIHGGRVGATVALLSAHYKKLTHSARGGQRSRTP